MPPIEVLWGQTGGGRAPFRVEAGMREKDRVGSLPLPISSGLLPAALWPAHLFLYAALCTTFPCYRNCHNGDLHSPWSQFHLSSAASLEILVRFPPSFPTFVALYLLERSENVKQ